MYLYIVRTKLILHLNSFCIATGGEEIADLRGKLDVLHQELDKGEATGASSFGLKVKACLDQSQTAFNKVRMERTCLQEQIDELTKQKLELEKKVEALELKQGIIIIIVWTYLLSHSVPLY